MKKNSIVVAIILVTSTHLSAQFGLDKLKNKVEKSSSKKETETKENKSETPISTTSNGIKVSDEQKEIEKELEVYNAYVQGSRTYDMMMGLKKENKTAEHFTELVTKYNSFSTKNESSLRHIKRAEEFYAKMKTAELTETEADVNRIFTRANAFEYNENPLLLKGIKQEVWRVFPKYVIEDITKLLPELIDQKTYLYTDKTKIDELIKKCENEKTRLETYIKIDYIKFKVDYDKEKLDKVVLAKEVMNDPTLNSFVKTKFDAKYGKVIKVVIVDDKWTIKKSASGIPTYKVISYQASLKATDGSCKKQNGTIAMQYEGGGKYGDKYLNYFDIVEMSCENVNK